MRLLIEDEAFEGVVVHVESRNGGPNGRFFFSMLHSLLFFRGVTRIAHASSSIADAIKIIARPT